MGAENHVTSCNLGILVDQAAEPISPQNPDINVWGWCMRRSGGRILVECPVRSAFMLGDLPNPTQAEHDTCQGLLSDRWGCRLRVVVQVLQNWADQ